MKYLVSIFKSLFFKLKNHTQLTAEQITLTRQCARRIGYHFRNQELLIQALKHRSYLSVSNEERLSSNERLELLGDAVLGLVVTDYLYHKFPANEEGELTSVKSLVVSREILATTSKKLGLGDFILMNEAEDKAGGRNRASILADGMEALIGAIYLDRGLENAKYFIRRNILKELKKILAEEKNKNFKSILLEYSQGKNLGLPFYFVKNQEGPDHNKLFTVEVIIQNETLGCGRGTSKKIAEQQAAQNALKKLLVI